MVLKRCGELQPGMVIAKDVHTRAGLLLITSGEEVDNESIEKLKNNEVSFVFVKEKKDLEKASAKPVSYSDERYSYYEKVLQSPDYKLFRGKFSSGVVKLRGTLNRIVDGNPDADLETTAKKIMGDLIMPEGSLPIFDLLSNLRRFDDVCYVHSLNVALLAGLLAEWLGCSPKEIALAQQCGLYHDIGKMLNPVFFTENQAGVNPHDKLNDLESARIIISHVTEGLKLAEKYNLPREIKEFITTHHGTGLTKYFYIHYKNEHPDEEVNEEQFRYPGPNPFTREQAILMMSDTVEAASRSLKEYTEESISTLVNRLIDDQVAQGFFTDCPITFRDITAAKNVLIERLKSMYHTRIQYPELKV